MKIHIDWSDNQTLFKTGFLLKHRLKKAIRAALVYENFTQDVMVSVTFTDNAGIRELNREYRQKDAATDVLSFPMYTMEDDDRPEVDMAAQLGDIVLSLERAAEQAAEYGHSFRRETAFLTVHSMLHLLGYDHERSEEEEKDMFRRQEEIMNILGLPRK
ncbi:MAG: rRNA maturation RNase YbeY [Ruminococcaceae bacterium]|nr:rRNA maturation RNase YbeY [Oscillospiraceae bacterium]